MHKILVNVMREEIRMAVIDEEGQLVDFVLERTDESHMANHMYKGTVKNVLNGMQAAFVDIGGSQNAYLNLQQGKEQKNLATPICGATSSCSSRKRGDAR